MSDNNDALWKINETLCLQNARLHEQVHRYNREMMDVFRFVQTMHRTTPSPEAKEAYRQVMAYVGNILAGDEYKPSEDTE